MQHIEDKGCRMSQTMCWARESMVGPGDPRLLYVVEGAMYDSKFRDLLGAWTSRKQVAMY